MALSSLRELIKMKKENLRQVADEHYRADKELIIKAYKEFILDNTSDEIDEKTFLCRYNVRLVSIDLRFKDIFMKADDEWDLFSSSLSYISNNNNKKKLFLKRWRAL